MAILRRLIIAALTAVLAILAAPLGALPTAGAQQCPDVEVVFARGTGQPPGLGYVGDALVGDLRTQIAPRTVGGYGVNYPANDDFFQVAPGAVDATARVQWLADNCPNTKPVLGGFSQGAGVIDIVAGVPVLGILLGAPISQVLADRVAAVAVFGNPSDRIGAPITTLSPLLGYKSIDLCNVNDPVCSNGNDVNAHSLYVQSGMVNQAATFIAGRL
jgi:cutinase